MPFCAHGVFITLVLGIIMGIVGFLPLAVTTYLVRSGRTVPKVPKGLIAVAVSFAFLSAVLVFGYAVAPDSLVVLALGILVGFFTMCAIVAVTECSDRRCGSGES